MPSQLEKGKVIRFGFDGVMDWLQSQSKRES